MTGREGVGTAAVLEVRSSTAATRMPISKASPSESFGSMLSMLIEPSPGRPSGVSSRRYPHEPPHRRAPSAAIPRRCSRHDLRLGGGQREHHASGHPRSALPWTRAGGTALARALRWRSAVVGIRSVITGLIWIGARARSTRARVGRSRRRRCCGSSTERSPSGVRVERASSRVRGCPCSGVDRSAREARGPLLAQLTWAEIV
jgi:hypothetical protein